MIREAIRFVLDNVTQNNKYNLWSCWCIKRLQFDKNIYMGYNIMETKKS